MHIVQISTIVVNKWVEQYEGYIFIDAITLYNNSTYAGESLKDNEIKATTIMRSLSD